MSAIILNQMDDSGVKKQHIRLFALAAAGIFVDGYDLSIIAAALLSLVPSLHPTSIQTGWLGTAALIGTAVGAASFGRLTDHLGRKAMFMIDLVFFVVFAIAAGLAPNMLWVIIFRFLLGIGIGADYPIAASYVAEIVPKNHRGTFLAATIGMWGVGALVSYLVSIVILTVNPGPDAWRYILASGAVPAAIVIILRSTMPESPRWLMAKNKVVGLKKCLEQVGVKATDTSISSGGTVCKEPFWKLFSPQFLRVTIFTATAWLLYDIVTYGIGIFQPTILKDLGFHTGVTALWGSVVVGLFGLVGTILGIWSIERAGRKLQLVIGLAGMGLALLLLGIFSATGSNTLPAAALIGLFGFYNLSNYWGPSPATYVLPAELYPTSLRASGHGFAAMSGKVGAAVGVFFLPVLQAAVGVSNLMYILTAVAVLGSLFSLIVGVETKGGKSLEEIERELLAKIA